MTTVITILFIAGYCAIMFERAFKINKADIALLTGVACWAAYIFFSLDKNEVVRQLIERMGDFSGILFFLMGAMAIVELIDAHNGFSIITNAITTRNKIALLWIISLFAFFLSAVIDNLTTTIVMISLVSKIILDREDIKLFAAMIVIGANAGGAWTPIGDVTTTMLWIGERISSTKIVTELFLPSVICLIVPLIIVTLALQGKKENLVAPKHLPEPVINLFHRNAVFFTGIGVLLLVPVFKAVTHLPPFMGVLLGFGIMWVLVEILHKKEHDNGNGRYSMARTLGRIDLLNHPVFFRDSTQRFRIAEFRYSARLGRGHRKNYTRFQRDGIVNWNSFRNCRQCSACCRRNGNVWLDTISERPPLLDIPFLLRRDWR